MAARLASALTAAWQRRGVAALLLWPFALLYRLALALRGAGYHIGLLQSRRLPVPVIVVGNLYVGGTGKTPLVIALVRALAAHGWPAGIVSRGYGRSDTGVRLVGGDDTATTVGDEPLLLAQATGAPVAVGARRAEAARALLAAHPQCRLIVADDGLQHRALARDFEIALIDERGLGNGWLLPAGPLREPAARLRTVDAVVLHNAATAPLASAPTFALTTHLAPTLRRLGDAATTRPLAEFVRRQRADGLTITAAAGIGVPQRFFDMLTAAGLRVTPRPLPDHHTYDAASFAQLTTDVVLITAKDAVKCAGIEALRSDTRIWVAPLESTLAPALIELLLARLTALTQRPPHGSPAA